MSGVQDGIVFVDLELTSDAVESFNVSAITRIRQLNKEQCAKYKREYPAVRISVLGMEQDVIIGNLTHKEFKGLIQDAIEKHYDSIAEKFLLDKDK